jgi:hypothetical protein
MARPAETCAECRALVAADQMAAHIGWHTSLTTAIGLVTTRTNANHPHGPVAASAERSAKK